MKEKVAYLKGLMEGMEYDVSTKEGKLMAAVVETLDAMAARVEEIDTDVDQLFDEVDAVSEDLEDVEDYLFDGEDGDEEDYADEYEAGLYEITCPNCGEVVCVDEDMLASDDLTCPNCGKVSTVDEETLLDQTQELVCPYCNASFDIELEGTEDEQPEDNDQ